MEASAMKRCSVLVIGLGYFGQAVAETLLQMGHEVVGVDRDQQVVESVRDWLENLYCFDATDEDLLRRLGVSDFDACVVGTGADLGNSVLLTAILRDLGAKFIAAKAVTDRQAQILRKVGADLIVFPEKEMGQRLAHQLLSPGRILEHWQFDPEWSIEEIEAPAWMIGKTLRELDLRRRHGVTVIALRRKGQILPNPAGDDAIQKGDWLVVFGRNADLERMVMV